MSTSSPPSIQGRLGGALLLWALVGGAGVAAAVAYATQHEVNELLDETLQASAAMLSGALRELHPAGGAAGGATLLPTSDEGDFAWQVVDDQGRVLRRTDNAPAVALQSVPVAGFSEHPQWRVFGTALGEGGRMLYVAHALDERREARAVVALSAALASLAIGLLGLLWLRARVRFELLPLQRLSERLALHDPVASGAAIGVAERAELVPVHAAIDHLSRNLARRLAHERAFSAHAAHALRTPLAGIEAQLAVALRESAPPVQERLRRVREASSRLQRVVRSLLDLFRAGEQARWREVDVAALLAHLPVEDLQVVCEGSTRLQADPDLLAAALANLLDNAQRHGAGRVVVSQPSAGVLRLQDDGPGLPAEQLDALRVALRAQNYDERMGLGLMLADLVARAHGGALALPAVSNGFVVELALGIPPNS